MEEQLISFETAKFAKEKGFNYMCSSWYSNSGKLTDSYLENGSSTDVEFRVDLKDHYENYNISTNKVSAPTQSLLQKWLREKHNLHISIYTVIDNKKTIKYTYLYSPWNDWDTYEEALEMALQENLNLIQK